MGGVTPSLRAIGTDREEYLKASSITSPHSVALKERLAVGLVFHLWIILKRYMKLCLHMCSI